jgi:hypothetical protein
MGEPMDDDRYIPGHRLLSRRELRVSARLLLWSRVVRAVSGAAGSALLVILAAGRVL